MNLKNKKILLGLTGGIAIYKSASLLRRLVHDEGVEIRVVMTKSAQQFMTPLIFETFSKKPVLTDMFSGGMVSTRHIDLANDSDLILICPATADIVAKTANGIADDLLSTIVLAAGNKTIFALAMNMNMYENPITLENIQKLKKLGYGFIEPEEGDLACNNKGKGRLADERIIIEYLDTWLNGKHLLKGKKAIVTAGPTREYIDPVRFISNRSTGKMGFALAEEAVKEDGNVLLITGPTMLKPPPGVEVIRVESAREMGKVLSENAGEADFLFMSAAVEDFCPANFSENKIKKSEPIKEIPLTLSPDLVSSFRAKNPKACIVGFSVEIEDGKNRSIQKLVSKNMDYIVWNDPSKDGTGFESDTNEVLMFSANGDEWYFKKNTKRKIAEMIIKTVVRNISSLPGGKLVPSHRDPYRDK
ncbi:MAG: bifunctional phosphopantothenoylcysteine decarboxylase/phosphopantothenate--cysteine ligase CoaBC [Candidatus Marinimicrobia bacterium]|nr:bifunctional phosphopantothenoylcysteine decarboxylase/phosphopantothenate--cysteine ligase CoaBC [Candidatus Neomarinimicrobiota bacterium]